MSRKQYFFFMFLLRIFLYVEGYKVRTTSTQEQLCKCGEVLSFLEARMELIFSDRIIFYYVALCGRCGTVYLHKYIKIKKKGEEDEIN